MGGESSAQSDWIQSRSEPVNPAHCLLMRSEAARGGEGKYLCWHLRSDSAFWPCWPGIGWCQCVQEAIRMCFGGAYFAAQRGLGSV